MEFKEFIKFDEAIKGQRVWRSATAQPYYSRIAQRPHRPFLQFPNDSSEIDTNFLYYQGIIKGVEKHFDTLFNYLKKYIRIFYRKYDTVPFEDIEDSFQDSIQRMMELKQPLDYDDKSSVDKFFRTIMRNKLFDTIRRKRSTELEDSIDSTPSPLHSLISKETLTKIKDVLSVLIKEKPKEMAAFCLGFGLGCYKNGKLVVPSAFEFSPIYKAIKTGLSNKIDYKFIRQELAKRGIKVTENGIAQSIFKIRNAIKQYLSGFQYECVDSMTNFDESKFVEFIINESIL